MMGVILLGAPGVGKGTQAKFITQRFNIPQISTGDMLRNAINAGSEMGQCVKAIMDRGLLVPDAVVISLVKQRLQEDDCNNGYLFDGFPRTVAQANSLDEAQVRISHVVEIVVPESEIIQRLSGRRVHLASGRTYHVLFNQPLVANLDDVSGEALIQREDDKEETVKQRLAVYTEQTAPLIDYYAHLAGIKYIKIDGTMDVESVTQQLLQQLSQV